MNMVITFLLRHMPGFTFIDEKSLDGMPGFEMHYRSRHLMNNHQRFKIDPFEVPAFRSEMERQQKNKKKSKENKSD